MGFFFKDKTATTKINSSAEHQWLMSVILATQETGIRKIMVRGQPGQIVCETLSQKYRTQEKLTECPASMRLLKSQYHTHTQA
jgi:hypothetical protein